MNGVLDDMDGIAPSDIAERWFARLMAPDCTLREREQFEAWLAQSPENALAFEETKALWAGLGGLETDEVLGELASAALQPEPFMANWTTAADGITRRQPGPSSGRRRNAVAGIAASVLVGVLAYIAWSPAVPPVSYDASDKIESLKLSDGSSVQLDLATSIEVKLGEHRRDVAIQQGRAMFEVAKDADRPFMVDAGVGTITAIGTQFEVERAGQRVTVTLLEGSVGIATAGSQGSQKQLRLSPGQRAIYAPATQSWAVETADATALTSWSQGFHVFSETPLREAVAQINRYSDVKLALSTGVEDLVVSGSFKLGDGRAVSEALPYALPVVVSEKSGEILISKR